MFAPRVGTIEKKSTHSQKKERRKEGREKRKKEGKKGRQSLFLSLSLSLSLSLTHTHTHTPARQDLWLLPPLFLVKSQVKMLISLGKCHHPPPCVTHPREMWENIVQQESWIVLSS